jgi:hypothetical protein
MSSAAQRDETSPPDPPTGTDERSALKKLAAERLAAHRNRHAVVEGGEVNARRRQAEAQAAIRLQARREAEGHADALRVREAVAARYEHSPSYKEVLAEEARRSIARAQAEAEVAARNAVAVEQAQRQLLEEMQVLEEIEQWKEPAVSAGSGTLFGEMPVLEIVAPEVAALEIAEQGETNDAEGPRGWRKVLGELSSGFRPQQGTFLGSLTTQEQLQVRLPEDAEWAPRSEGHRVSPPKVQAGAEEIAELDEEIEFRLSPEFPDLVLETQTIPGNILEFPRELIASRKARPRLAEGPLLDDGTQEAQLRIFEVEPENISAEPEVAALAEAPEWQGLLLGAGQSAEGRAAISRQLETQLQLDHQIYAAPVPRRLLAATIDGLCVAAGLAGFAVLVIKIAGPVLQPVPLAGAVGLGMFLFFAVIYQLLFFTLNDVTPGMRMTRMAFCTFGEDNPSRKAIRRRLISVALAACPLGLGLVWMVMDSDGLGWHDRMSRMYPRAY